MAAKHKRRAWRLKCELLEDRTAPAIVTQRLFDINQNTDSGVPLSPWFTSTPYNWAAFNGSVYFSGNDRPPNGLTNIPIAELWKTDGTSGGTVLVKDICPGFYGSDPYGFTVSNGILYFRADDGTRGPELWKTDGTAAGTVMVKDINTTSIRPGSYPLSLTDVNGTLYFVATDAAYGRELWKSDGTAGGTVMVADLTPGRQRRERSLVPKNWGLRNLGDMEKARLPPKRIVGRCRCWVVPPCPRIKDCSRLSSPGRRIFSRRC